MIVLTHERSILEGNFLPEGVLKEALEVVTCALQVFETQPYEDYVPVLAILCQPGRPLVC